MALVVVKEFMFAGRLVSAGEPVPGPVVVNGRERLPDVDRLVRLGLVAEEAPAPASRPRRKKPADDAGE